MLVRQCNLGIEFELDWETWVFRVYQWILALTCLPSLGHGWIWTCGWTGEKLSCRCAKLIPWPSIQNCAFKAVWSFGPIVLPKLIIRKDPQKNTLTPFPACLTLRWRIQFTEQDTNSWAVCGREASLFLELLSVVWPGRIWGETPSLKHRICLAVCRSRVFLFRVGRRPAYSMETSPFLSLACRVVRLRSYLK